MLLGAGALVSAGFPCGAGGGAWGVVGRPYLFTRPFAAPGVLPCVCVCVAIAANLPFFPRPLPYTLYFLFVLERSSLFPYIFFAKQDRLREACNLLTTKGPRVMLAYIFAPLARRSFFLIPLGDSRGRPPLRIAPFFFFFS